MTHSQNENTLADNVKVCSPLTVVVSQPCVPGGESSLPGTNGEAIATTNQLQNIAILESILNDRERK